jgi:hypothetical protein
MPNVQQMIPTSAAPAQIKCYGRTYTAVVGGTVTCPDADAAVLSANGWVAVSSAGAGTSAQRPASAPAGATFFDQTLNILIVAIGKGRWASHVDGSIV